MKLKVTIILLVSIFLLSSVYAGGPWGPGKQKSYLQFGGSTIPSTNKLFYKGSETLVLNRKIRDNSFGFYYEYGVSDKFTLIGELPFNFVGTESGIDSSSSLFPVLESGSLFGLGNIKITGKYKFYDKKIKLSAGMKISLPTASQNESLGLRTGYNSLDIMPQISVGYSNDKLYSYAEIGYNVYRSKLSNNFIFEAEVGYKVYKKTYVALHAGVMLSNYDNGNLNNPIEQTGLYSDGQEYASLTLKISVPIRKNLGINLNSTVANIYGNYVQQSPSIGGSLYLKF